MKVKNDLDLDGELKLNDYLSTQTSFIDNDVDYALGVDSFGNTRMIERSVLGSSSEAFFAYLDTGGGTVDTTSTLVAVDTVGLNTNAAVFSLASGVLTVNADMNVSLSFAVGVAEPNTTRIAARANVEVSTDGGSSWSEVLGSRCWAYIRQGTNNDDHTLGGTTVLRANTSGDKYRVVARTMTGSATIINYASSLSVHDLSGGEAGPTGPAGAAGATNTSLVLDGSNVLTLTDSDSDTVTVDLSTLAGTTPTLDDVTTAGGNTNNNIGIGNLTAQGSISAGGFQVNGGFGFVCADEEEEGFHVQDVDEADILTITGSIAGSDAQFTVDASVRLSDYLGNVQSAVTPTALLGVDNNGYLGLSAIVAASGPTISDFTTVSNSTSSVSCLAGVMYIIDLANNSNSPAFSLPSTGNDAGDQIWIACNSTTSNHSRLLSVGVKLYDTGSSNFTFGGRTSGSNFALGRRDTLKWIWTGSYWYETTSAGE